MGKGEFHKDYIRAASAAEYKSDMEPFQLLRMVPASQSDIRLDMVQSNPTKSPTLRVAVVSEAVLLLHLAINIFR